MANEKISDLPDGGAIQGSDELVVARGATNVKIAGTQVGGGVLPDYTAQWFVSGEIGDNNNTGTNLAHQLETIDAGIAKAVVVGQGQVTVTDDNTYEENVFFSDGELPINFDASFVSIAPLTGVPLNVSRTGQYEVGYIEQINGGEAALVINTTDYVDIHIKKLVGNTNAIKCILPEGAGTIKIDECEGTMDFNGARYNVEIGTLNSPVLGDENLIGYIGTTIYGNTRIAEELEVNGTSQFDGEVTIGDPLHVNSFMNVTDAVTMESTCSIAGETTCDLNLTVTGNIETAQDITAVGSVFANTVVGQVRDVIVTNTSTLTINQWTVVQSNVPDSVPGQGIAVTSYAKQQGIVGIMLEQIVPGASGVAVTFGPIDLTGCGLGATAILPRELFVDDNGQLTYNNDHTPIGLVVNVDHNQLPTKGLINTPKYSYNPTVEPDRLEWQIYNGSGDDIPANRFVMVDPNINQHGGTYLWVSALYPPESAFSSFPVGYTESIIVNGTVGNILRRGFIYNPDIYYPTPIPFPGTGQVLYAYNTQYGDSNNGRLSNEGPTAVGIVTGIDTGGAIDGARIDMASFSGIGPSPP